MTPTTKVAAGLLKAGVLAGSIVCASIGSAAAQAGAPSAQAAPAGTADGAATLAGTMKAVLGDEPFRSGWLAVSPTAAGYRIAVDLGRLVGATAPTVADLLVRPRANGGWFFELPSLPTLSVRQGAVPGSFTIGNEGLRLEGAFDPTIMAPLSGAGSAKTITVTGNDPTDKRSLVLGGSTIAIEGKPARDGAADLRFRQTAETASGGSLGPDNKPFASWRAGKTELAIDAASLRAKAAADLYAFFTVQPALAGSEQSSLDDYEATFKARMGAVLPLWERMGVTVKASALAGETPDGTFKAAQLRASLTTTGIEKAGRVAASFVVSGLDVASPALKAFAQPLVPRELDVTVALERLDLRSSFDIVTNDVDFGADDDQFERMGARPGQAFDANPPVFVLEPSRVRTADLDVAFSGRMELNGGKPSAVLSVEAKGLEETIEAVKAAAANEPDAAGVVTALSLAQGFGKPLPPGRLSWVVESAENGSIRVNGLEIVGADPAPRPVPTPPADRTDEPSIAPPPSEAPTDENALPTEPPR